MSLSKLKLQIQNANKIRFEKTDMEEVGFSGLWELV